LGWQFVNTDQMTIVEERAPVISMRHRVRLNGGFPPVSAYRKHFADGFREAYNILRQRRTALAEDPSVVEAIDAVDARVLLRDTSTYSELQLQLLHPEFLKDGVDRSIELEWLARPLCASRAPSNARAAVYECERLAMEGLDVPRFARSSLGQLDASSAVDRDLWALFGGRDSSVLLARLSRLSPPHLRRQLHIAGAAITARYGDG